MIPKVSIIVPVYNVELYLKECVESIRQQSLQDIEIILVDDKSPDNSPSICDKYAQTDTRIKVIHKPINEGLGFARNSGLEVATGEFIAFIDSDDFIDKNMFYTLYQEAAPSNADIVYCGLSFYRNNCFIKKEEVKKRTIYATEKERKELILDFVAPEPSYKSDVKYMMSACKAIYRRSIIKENKILFLSERKVLSEDIFFNIQMILKSHTIIFIPNSFYFYRYNCNSITHKFNLEKYKKHHIFFQELESLLQEHFYFKEYSIHIDRLKFLYLRNSISALFKDQTNKNPKDDFKVIINDCLWQTMLLYYPYWKLPIKHCLFFLFLKTKSYYLFKTILQ